MQVLTINLRILALLLNELSATEVESQDGRPKGHHPVIPNLLKSVQEVERYTKAAEQKRLAKSAMGKLEGQN